MALSYSLLSFGKAGILASGWLSVDIGSAILPISRLAVTP
jgi:hypothetical protein